MAARYISRLYLSDADCVKSFGDELHSLQEATLKRMNLDEACKCEILDNETDELIYYQINNN